MSKLDSKDTERLRSDLAVAKRHRKPAKWMFEGELRLFRNGQEVGRMDLYHGPGGAVPFRRDDRYYLPASSEVLRRALTVNGFRGS